MMFTIKLAMLAFMVGIGMTSAKPSDEALSQCQTASTVISTMTVHLAGISPTLTPSLVLSNYTTLNASTDAADAVSGALSTSAFYFAVTNGTTSWLNGDSPGTTFTSTVVQTMDVTVVPYISSSSSTPLLATNLLTTYGHASLVSTPISTLTSTSFITIDFTSEITVSASETASGNSPAGGSFTGAGTSGWNVSSTGVSQAGAVTGSPVTMTQSLLPTNLSSSANSTTTDTVTSTLEETLTLTIETTSQSSAAGAVTASLSGPSMYGNQTIPATGYMPSLSSQATFNTSAATVGAVSSSTSTSNSSAVGAFGTSLSTSSSSKLYSTLSALGTGGYSQANTTTSSSSTVNINGVSATANSSTASSSPSYLIVPSISVHLTILPLPNVSTSSSAANAVTASKSYINSTTTTSSSVLTSSFTAGAVTASASSSTPYTNSTSVAATSLSLYGAVNTSASRTDSPSVVAETTSTLSTIYTNSTSSATPTPSVCGEHGEFVLGFDDEPVFDPTTPITSPADAPPIFNPYHHLYFSPGFVYGPPPAEPFPPTSGTRLAMFVTNATGASDSSPNAGLEHPGELGAGDRASSSAFLFNAYSAYLGCDNEGPATCKMEVSGWTYQAFAGAEVLAYQENFTLAPCPRFVDCKLQNVAFPSAMRGLSGLQIRAFVGDEQRLWFMDDLHLGWYNNSCAAGLLRQASQ